MNKQVLLAVGIVAVTAILLVLYGQQDTPSAVPANQYDDSACIQTAFLCAQEKAGNATFDCTEMCESLCSPNLIERCIGGDYSMP